MLDLHPSTPVSLRPAGTERISVPLRCVISGGIKAAESGWSMLVSVHRGYGTGRLLSGTNWL